MTDEEKVKVAQPFLDKFETEEMRLYCKDMIEQIPDYIFTMPSSTSGKYHNKTQCQPHGQIYHIVMFASILNYRLGLKCNQEKFKSPQQRDAMRCVPWFHDAIKCGWEGSQFTVHEHPMLAAEWVRNATVKHDPGEKIKEAIACMCEAHSGEWTSSKKSKVVLPEPRNAMEIMIHECDYLSSRSDIDMGIPEYLNNIFEDVKPEPPDINTYKLTFGKMKGMTIPEIKEQAPDYLAWMLKQDDWREPIKSLLKQI